MTATVTPCGAWTPNGPCGRKVAPGNRCAFHPENGTNGSADADALSPGVCACEDALPVTDSHGEVRCVKCGHAPSPDERIVMPTGRKALEADLLRRSNEAAERRAVAEAEAEKDRPPFNPFTADPAFLERQAAKAQRDREALFGPEPPEQKPPTRPAGSADGGEGTPLEVEFDTTLDGQRFQRFDLDDLNREEST